MDNLYKLSNIPFFKFSALETIFPKLKKTSLYQKISRMIAKRKIIQLKKGYYITQEYYSKYKAEDSFRIYIANILRFPSYVSGTYVLQKYDILTDITYPITSITQKSSRRYRNVLGDFVYFSISEKLYTGYEILNYNNNSIYIASKVKAVFDFLYLKYLKSEIPDNLAEKERLDLSNFTGKEKKEFKKYCKLTNLSKFKNIYNLLFYE